MVRKENLWENIWNKGFKAGREGVKRAANPHPKGSDRWSVWDCGWQGANPTAGKTIKA